MHARFPVPRMRGARKWETKMKNVWRRENVTTSKLERFGRLVYKDTSKLLKPSIFPVCGPRVAHSPEELLLSCFRVQHSGFAWEVWEYGPNLRRGKQHQPNNWIIEWPNETACAAERINRLHHFPLGIHCFPSLSLSISQFLSCFSSFPLLSFFLSLAPFYPILLPSFHFPIISPVFLCRCCFTQYSYFSLTFSCLPPCLSSLFPSLFCFVFSFSLTVKPFKHLSVAVAPPPLLFLFFLLHSVVFNIYAASIKGTANQYIKSILDFY